MDYSYIQYSLFLIPFETAENAVSKQSTELSNIKWISTLAFYNDRDNNALGCYLSHFVIPDTKGFLTASG